MRKSFLIIALLVAHIPVLTTRIEAQGALNEEQVRRVLMLALDNITKAPCANAQPCAAATADERANPPLTLAEARVIITRGVLSAAGEHCGLDWQGRNFLPMMEYWRNQMKKTERQLVLAGLVHGIMQSMPNPDAQTKCSEQMRENVDRRLSFQP